MLNKDIDVLEHVIRRGERAEPNTYDVGFLESLVAGGTRILVEDGGLPTFNVTKAENCFYVCNIKEEHVSGETFEKFENVLKEIEKNSKGVVWYVFY